VPFSLVVDLDREGVHNVLRSSIGVTITDDSHAYVLSSLGSVEEIMDVITSSISSGSGRRFAHDRDNFSSSLLHFA